MKAVSFQISRDTCDGVQFQNSGRAGVEIMNCKFFGRGASAVRVTGAARGL